jgi:protein MYSM1
MEPNSLVRAQTHAEELRLEVVGWYHSHPTFPPEPSLRDLENQTAHQTAFIKQGVEPFVGVIVNPYDPDSRESGSKFNFITAVKAQSGRGMTCALQN